MLRPFRTLFRLLAIARILARHDALAPLQQLGVAPAVAWFAAKVSRREVGGRPGQKLVAALTELGPSFIKLGQFLSTRADLLGEPLAADLSELQDRLPPFDSAEARATIAAELDRPVDELFVRFSDEPVSAASIAQVQFAEIAGEGDEPARQVAVKVLRPGVERAFARDLDLFYTLAELAEQTQPQLRRFKPVEVVRLFEETVRIEMDLRMEAAAAAELADNFGDVLIQDLPTPFTAIGCELKTGHEVWLSSGSLPRAIQASFALPGVFEPVNWDGRWLVDGALVNPVPVSVCRALGAELVIAVNLAEDIYGRARANREGLTSTGQYGVYADVMEAPTISSGRGSRSIMRKLFGSEKGAPSLFANMLASLNIIQNRLSRSRLAGDPPDVTIAPRCGHVGLMEFNRADELIDEGRRAFEMAESQLNDALSIIGYRMNA